MSRGKKKAREAGVRQSTETSCTEASAKQAAKRGIYWRGIFQGGSASHPNLCITCPHCHIRGLSTAVRTPNPLPHDILPFMLFCRWQGRWIFFSVYLADDFFLLLFSPRNKDAFFQPSSLYEECQIHVHTELDLCRMIPTDLHSLCVQCNVTSTMLNAHGHEDRICVVL